MSKRPDKVPEVKKGEVDAFLAKLAVTPTPTPGQGRLIFAMDATASREPTWAQACQIQSEMFTATAALGGLQVQLVFYRGFNECKATGWLASADALVGRLMTVRCLGGPTPIGHARKRRVSGKRVD